MTAGVVERHTTRALGVASVVVFTLLVVVVTIQVATRQVLHAPAPWTEEAARYLFLILVFATAALVFWDRGHIAVTVAVRKLPLRGQLVMGLLIESLVFAFSAYVFVFGGVKIALNAWNHSLVALPGSVGQVYLVMPLAGVLICAAAVNHAVRMLRGSAPALPPSDEDIEV